MNTARKYSEKYKEPAYEKICNMMKKLDALALKISKSETFTPPQEEIDSCAREIIEIVNKHHSVVVKFETYLRNAVIDLTEIPYMQPQMQKIAFEVAVKAAARNLQSFLDHVII